MGVPFCVRFEDRLFPGDMKSRSRLAALWNGHGQRFASWVENVKWSLTVSPVYVDNKGGVNNNLFE